MPFMGYGLWLLMNVMYIHHTCANHMFVYEVRLKAQIDYKRHYCIHTLLADETMQGANLLAGNI